MRPERAGGRESRGPQTALGRQTAGVEEAGAKEQVGPFRLPALAKR